MLETHIEIHFSHNKLGKQQFPDLETHFSDPKPGVRQNNSSELDEPPALIAVTASVISCSTDSIGSFALLVAARSIRGPTDIGTRAVL